MSPSTASKGSIDILILAIVVLFGILLAGGVTFIDVAPQTNAPNGILVPSPYPMHTSLQLSTFGFIPLTNALPTGCNGDFSSIFSSESTILYAWDPPAGSSASPGGKIKVWAADEHGISIGTSGHGATATSSRTNPDHANPAPVGDLTARDCGPGTIQKCVQGQAPLPLFPALYLVDRTVNPTAVSADALKNTPYPANEVWGSWKKFLDPNPPANKSNVGGGDPFPATPFPYTQPNTSGHGRELQLGSELIWNVDTLGLITGHTYAAVFVIHDGDNHPGADIGVGCTTIQY
jgi:hypothetical protein